MTRRRLYWVVGNAAAAVVLLVMALFAALSIGGTVFLKTDLASEVINRRPEKLRVDYAAARSPWPGRVVVEEFRIRGQTRKVQWEATATRLEGDVDLLALFGKRFVASDVRGEGVVFRLRRRRDAFEEMEVPASQTPPVSGLENPPRRPPEELYELPEDRRRWTVSLRDWRLDDVEEIWIDQYRYGGSATVEGGFVVELKRTTRIRPTTMALEGGELRVGEQAVATDVEAMLVVDSDRFPHQEVRGVETIPHFELDLEARARVHDLHFLNLYVDALPWLAFEEGAGRLEADLHLADGRLQPGSRLGVSPDPITVRLLDYRASGSGHLDWRASEDDGGTGRLHTHFGDFQIRRHGAEEPHVRGEGLRVEVTSRDLGVPARFQDAVVTVELPEAEVPDFSYYDDYLPDGVGIRITAGTGTVAGRFELRAEDASGSGELDLRGDQVRLEYKGGTMTGDVELASRFPRADLETRRFDLDGSTVRVDDGRVFGGEAVSSDEPPWWMQVRLESGTLQPGASPVLETTARIEMKDSRPVVGLFALHKGLPGWVQKALRVEDVRGEGRLRVGAAFVELDRFHAVGEKLEAKGVLRFATGNRHGQLLLTYRGFDLGVALRGEETDYKLIGAAEWYERRVDDDGG